MQKTIAVEQYKQPLEFDFLALLLEALEKHFEGPIGYKTIRSFLACRFCFTKAETRAALRALQARYPQEVRLKNRHVLFTHKEAQPA